MKQGTILLTRIEGADSLHKIFLPANKLVPAPHRPTPTHSRTHSHNQLKSHPNSHRATQPHSHIATWRNPRMANKVFPATFCGSAMLPSSFVRIAARITGGPASQGTGKTWRRLLCWRKRHPGTLLYEVRKLKPPWPLSSGSLSAARWYCELRSQEFGRRDHLHAMISKESVESPIREHLPETH